MTGRQPHDLVFGQFGVGTPAAWQAVRHAVRQRRTGMPSRWKTSAARR